MGFVAGWEGSIWGDGVNGQRKTRGEAMNIGVSEKHGAHFVVRESVKLLIRVLLLWVRCGSRTMRDMFWVMKDGYMVSCGIRCWCGYMRVPVQRSALKQRSECVAEERKTGKTECMGVLVRNESRTHDCPYV